MQIYIPTLRRNETQITLRSLPQEWHANTTLVVDKDDGVVIPGKPKAVKILVCPDRGIGKVRQFIVDSHDVKKYGPAVLMLDDDLRFFIRRLDDRTKFLKATETDIGDCFALLASEMGGFAHGGIVAREGGNRVKNDVVHNTRLLRALAYDVSILRKVGARFDRLPVMEDFDVSLQLLRAGYPSIGLAAWVQDQTKSNAPGGCSTYRTLDVQAEGARGLAKLHAPFVTVLEKTTKTAWGGATRTDVRVSWGKAYASSKR